MRVLHAGTLTTVQDPGRPGFAHLGVSAAGAADPFTLSLANRLAGNREREAALEITLTGPRLAFEKDAVIALAGGRLAAHVDDVPIAMEQTVAVRAGQVLSLGALSSGLRTYLAVAGGIRVGRVLGSRATDTLAGLGPPPLAHGQRLPIRAAQLRHARYLRRPWRLDTEQPLRILPGPRADWFTTSALERLLSEAYRVDAASDRTGVRLQGPALERADARELHSEGMATGALQVPAGGQPIALLPNHGPTGGYPAIATLISADQWRIAQARPGQSVTFRQVSRAEALDALRAQAGYLRRAVATADAELLRVRELIWLSQDPSALGELEVEHAGGHIRLRR